MSERYDWLRTTTDGRKVSQGFILVGRDENGLPVLDVYVDDDWYNGRIDHRTLMRLLTELAQSAR